MRGIVDEETVLHTVIVLPYDLKGTANVAQGQTQVGYHFLTLQHLFVPAHTLKASLKEETPYQELPLLTIPLQEHLHVETTQLHLPRNQQACLTELDQQIR
jgi:hypothetical protein